MNSINTFPTDIDLAENPSQVELEKVDETENKDKEAYSNFVPVKMKRSRRN